MDNIFLTHDHRTVLIDFGSARTYHSNRTVRHTQLVTPGYAAPEQYASSAKFGPYTDLYALGATLYHALSGKMPPPATDRMLGTPLEPLPNTVPSGLRQLIERCMALERAIECRQVSSVPSGNLPVCHAIADIEHQPDFPRGHAQEFTLRHLALSSLRSLRIRNVINDTTRAGR